MALEGAIEDATEKSKNKKAAQAMARRVLEKWLGDPKQEPKKQFSEPKITKK